MEMKLGGESERRTDGAISRNKFIKFGVERRKKMKNLDDRKLQRHRMGSGRMLGWVLLIIIAVAVYIFLQFSLKQEGPRVSPEKTESSYGIEREIAEVFDGKFEKVDTGTFNGEYKVDHEKSFPTLYGELEELEGEQRINMMMLIQFSKRMLVNFRIADGEIRSGAMPTQSFVLTKAQINDNVLQGRALWHEDIHDPGDCAMVNVRLELVGETLRFWYYAEDEDLGEPVVLERTNSGGM